jgi:hypothetical protein
LDFQSIVHQGEQQEERSTEEDEQGGGHLDVYIVFGFDPQAQHSKGREKKETQKANEKARRAASAAAWPKNTELVCWVFVSFKTVKILGCPCWLVY